MPERMSSLGATGGRCLLALLRHRLAGPFNSLRSNLGAAHETGPDGHIGATAGDHRVEGKDKCVVGAIPAFDSGVAREWQANVEIADAAVSHA